MAVNENPSVIEQMPATGGVNRPASGTYGEKAALDRLKAELPRSDSVPGAQQPASPTPGGFGQQPRQAQAPGVPAALFAPSTRPDVPVSTPHQAQSDPFAGAVDARQRRMAYLDILSQHPDASPELREWAEIVKRKLIERG